LITNLYLANRSGSENFVELLADGLRRAGHTPAVYAPMLGEQAISMRRRGIAVADRLDEISETPDVIHAQHLTPAFAAMLRFPDVPVVYTCHSAQFVVEAPIPHPQIRSVVAVDEACARQCRDRGFAGGQVRIILNPVDLERFAKRSPLPARAGRALLLTKTPGQREAVAAACRRAGIALDELGHASGNVVADLEKQLPDYDIVFATARMALEAAAVGCAVIVCDDRGFAGMLTHSDLERWRRYNFGAGLLTHPTTEERLASAIARYDPADAARVCETLRDEAGLASFTERYLEAYREAIDSPAPGRDELASANAFWAEELAITPARRRWREIAAELNLFGQVSLEEAIARLERIEASLESGFGRFKDRFLVLDWRGTGIVQALRRIAKSRSG
jgi:hypothetical protein